MLSDGQVDRPKRRSVDYAPSIRPSADNSAPTVCLAPWFGPWEADDPDANFKHEIALYAPADPLAAIESLGNRIAVPSGAIARYVLARWASEGSCGLLEIGPSMVDRLCAVIDEAEDVSTDRARLKAYGQLRQMLRWLRLPLD